MKLTPPSALGRVGHRRPIPGWLLLLALALTHPVAAQDWQATQWRGESAFVADAGPWRAIVSVERARLVHLGRVDDGENVLFETDTRDHREGWGGHRVWLGPQGTWPRGWWPPPAEWERSPAEEVTARGPWLELRVPPAGHGWPRFTRTYAWRDGSLICGIAVEPDGARNAQVVQILQVPMTAVVETRLQPEPDWPAGYAGLRAGRRLDVQALAAPPPHAAIDGDRMTLRHTGAVEKLGFRPQPIIARIGDVRLSVNRGTDQGDIAGAPDAGFYTQVYLGNPNTFIELEQLSPLWAPGTPARFEMVITLQAVQTP